MEPATAGTGQAVAGPPHALSAAVRAPTSGQAMALLLLGAALAATAAIDFVLLGEILRLTLWLAFLTAALWRVAAVRLSRPRALRPLRRERDLPRYTILAPLHDEAAVAAQLVRRLAAIDYPAGRLEALLICEHDDAATLAALRACDLPPWMRVLTAGPGGPRTKPRALNLGLNAARGELAVVYDAEDAPDPLQLREAARRFRDGPDDLVCLQAPLRIRAEPDSFLTRQFAAEYAALFEVILPALARLGAPFPLGGTSNHFRVAQLRAAGGWDPYNVTEDADLGFRLARRGGRLGMLTRPTWESPTARLRDWLPQRTRWLKGFMQTWGVHMRRPGEMGLQGFVAFQLTIGQAILTAGLHALMTAVIVAVGLLCLAQGVAPRLPAPDLALLCAGWGFATLCCRAGAERAGVPYGLRDALLAPAYWSLLSLAWIHAALQLARRPFHWDKTAHVPDAWTEPVRATGRAAA